jgi:UDP-glucuronate decarboxylase
MKKTLVTGGAGFIGSHLCELLLDRGDKVICLDNFITGTETNIESFRKNSRFTLIEADVENLPFIECDEIFNLACPASPFHYRNEPLKTLRASVLGSIKILELASVTGAKVLQASTSEVYGDPEIHPQHESYNGNVNTVGPRSCYDEGKRCAETLFMNYKRQEGVNIRIVRIFNTYGPRMRPDDGRVISNFIVQALKGEPITVFGDGSQTRSFQYIDDLVTGLVRMMEADDGLTGPLNLGNTDEYRITDLAERIKKMTMSSSEIVFLPLPGEDPRKRKPDISQAISHLGWKPVTDLSEGLEKTINYFRKIVNT